ncbi:hypothetical protein ACQ4PT_023429 [Festuca glaucescens]
MDTETGEAGFQHSPGAPTSPVAPFVRSSSRLDAAHSFDGALRVEPVLFGPTELKDLRYQLHQAADCCEKAFLGTEQKRLILDSTKSYICDAVVTVIDHLGTVSSKLEQQLEDKTEITQTERKISFLKQRLLTCEQYAISLNLLALRMDTGALQYHRRYLSQSTERNNEENVADSRGHPVPGANRTLKPYDVESTIGREVAVAVPNVGNPASITRSFSFRAEVSYIISNYIFSHLNSKCALNTIYTNKSARHCLSMMFTLLQPIIRRRKPATAATSCHSSREVSGMHKSEKRHWMQLEMQWPLIWLSEVFPTMRVQCSVTEWLTPHAAAHDQPSPSRAASACTGKDGAIEQPARPTSHPPAAPSAASACTAPPTSSPSAGRAIRPLLRRAACHGPTNWCRRPSPVRLRALLRPSFPTPTITSVHGGKMQQIEEGAAIVARYMASLRSQGFGSSHMRTQEDDEVHNEEIPFEGDEDDDDENYELEEDFDDEDIGEGSNAVSQGRKFISKSWQEFVPIHVDGEVTRGECKHCGTLISAKRGHGTSGLRNHLNICHARATVVGALNQMNATLMTPDGVSRLWKWDPDVARKMLVRMVVLHELPLSIVEYEGFRKFVSSLNPSFHMITRKTLKNDIMKAFDEHKKSLKDLFGASKSRISLTMDLWTSNQTIGYIVITSHFINDCWKLEKRIIKFNALETPHT